MLSLLAAAVCWGLAPVATRFAVLSIAPNTVLMLRFGVAALALLPALRSRPAVRGGQWLALAGAGLVGVVGYNLPVAYGLQRVPAGVASLLIATEPMLIAVLASMWLRERGGARLIAGLLLAGAGTAVLIGSREHAPGLERASLAGMALVLFAAAMWSGYTVWIRQLVRSLPASFLTTSTTIVGTLWLGLLLGPFTPLSVHGISGAGWSAILFLGLGSTAAATLLWNTGLATVPAARAGLFLNVIPLVGVAGGAVLLGEPVGPTTLGAAALILAGVAVGSR